MKWEAKDIRWVIWASSKVLVLRESIDLRRGQDTYSEGGTHEETLCPQSKAKVGTRDEGDQVTT